MASSTCKLCGQCEARYKTTSAISWCMDCDDGLCSPCLEDHKVNKASRKHHTIPVSQYVQIESVSSQIKQECEEHEQRLTFYCIDHCVTACALCVPEKHKQCTSLKPIEELALNAKTSTELFEIEKGIKELDNTVDELKNHRQRNIDTNKDQRNTIAMEIKAFRKQINKHLDDLESDLLKELESKIDQSISEINMLIEKLKEKATEIKSLEKIILQMKESLSDVQVFLATKSIGEKLREQQEWVSTLCNQDEAKESVVELISDPHLTYLLSDLNCFGLIQIVRNPCQIRVRVWEEQRAQLNVATTTVRDIGNVKLELIRKISFEHVEGLTSIKDCVLVKDGRMIFANSKTNKVLVHSHDGQLLNTVTVGKFPFGLAVINSNTVAVTCLENQTIQIVNIDDGVVKQTIHVGKTCSGLSYRNDRLYVIAEQTGIMEFDLVGGNLIRTISVNVPSEHCYLSSYKDRFCYTCYNKFIACVDSNGREIWRLNAADSGVTVDSFGTYYASKYDKKTLQIVSSDGKRTKKLLPTENSECHDNFEGVFFDKQSCRLLVACSSSCAMLYRII